MTSKDEPFVISLQACQSLHGSPVMTFSNSVSFVGF